MDNNYTNSNNPESVVRKTLALFIENPTGKAVHVLESALECNFDEFKHALSAMTLAYDRAELMSECND